MNEDSMNNKEQRAAEFVLGTLDLEERSRIHSDRQTDPELEAMIQVWESRMLPLTEEVSEASPGDHVFANIQAQLNSAKPGKSTAKEAATRFIQDNPLIEGLQQRLRRWQWSAFAGFALAAVFLLLWQWPTPQTTMPFVAVFQQDDQQPAFLMSVDLDNRVLKIQAISAQGIAGRTYQLWIKADPLGPNPQSLGLLETVSQPVVKRLDGLDPDLLQKATFGISVEPAGGSPTGQPTGPAIHGFLYPAGVGI